MPLSSVCTCTSASRSCSISITCWLMRSTAGCTAFWCSGETFRMPIRPPTTLSTSPSEEEEEEEEEGGSEECTMPICLDGPRQMWS